MKEKDPILTGNSSHVQFSLKQNYLFYFHSYMFQLNASHIQAVK